MTELSMAHYFKELNNYTTSDRQYGFKTGSSTAHATKGLYTFLQSLPKQKLQPQGVLLIDFSKAYDRVNRAKLYNILEELEVKEEELNLLKAIHNNSALHIGDI